MTNIIAWLKGKKTYAVAVLLFLVVGAQGMGYISAEQAMVLKGLLAAGGLAALRASVAK